MCAVSALQGVSTYCHIFASADICFRSCWTPPSLRRIHICFTCIDRFTRWPKTIPIPDNTAKIIARAFISGWIARLVLAPQIEDTSLSSNCSLTHAAPQYQAYPHDFLPPHRQRTGRKSQGFSRTTLCLSGQFFSASSSRYWPYFIRCHSDWCWAAVHTEIYTGIMAHLVGDNHNRRWRWHHIRPYPQPPFFNQWISTHPEAYTIFITTNVHSFSTFQPFPFIVSAIFSCFLNSYVLHHILSFSNHVAAFIAH